MLIDIAFRDDADSDGAGNAEQHWQRLTTQGNALFRLGDWDHALPLYEHARSLALCRFGHWPHVARAVAAVVVSYLNLSEALARAGRIDEASAVLFEIHGAVLRAVTDPHLKPAIRQAAQRNLRECHGAVLRFQELHGARPELTSLIRQSGDSLIEAECPAGLVPAGSPTLH